MEQRSIHSPSSVPQLSKCQGCTRIISNVASRGIDKRLCEDCSSGRTDVKAIKFSRDCFKRWKETKIPIYQFDLLHQTAIRFAILDQDRKRMPIAEFRKRRHQVYENWVKRNRTRKRKNDNIRWHIIVRRKFALFWDRVENTKECQYCRKLCSGQFCNEICHDKKKALNNKAWKKNYIRREDQRFTPW